MICSICSNKINRHTKFYVFKFNDILKYLCVECFKIISNIYKRCVKCNKLLVFSRYIYLNDFLGISNIDYLCKDKKSISFNDLYFIWISNYTKLLCCNCYSNIESNKIDLSLIIN